MDEKVDSQQGPVATFRAHADLVLIPVTVTDKLNRFVLGLQKEDFRLFEDGVDQNIEIFSGEDAPLSVGMLFDESGSMIYKFQSSREAAAQLLNTLNKEDETFLVEFSDDAKVSVGFTNQTQKVRIALEHAKAGGLTAMIDAIDTGLQEMKRAKCKRRSKNRPHHAAPAG
jgi:Ca-activated chloride channel family protein